MEPISKSMQKTRRGVEGWQSREESAAKTPSYLEPIRGSLQEPIGGLLEQKVGIYKGGDRRREQTDTKPEVSSLYIAALNKGAIVKK